MRWGNFFSARRPCWRQTKTKALTTLRLNTSDLSEHPPQSLNNVGRRQADSLLLPRHIGRLGVGTETERASCASRGHTLEDSRRRSTALSGETSFKLSHQIRRC